MINNQNNWARAEQQQSQLELLEETPNNWKMRSHQMPNPCDKAAETYRIALIVLGISAITGATYNMPEVVKVATISAMGITPPFLGLSYLSKKFEASQI